MNHAHIRKKKTAANSLVSSLFSYMYTANAATTSNFVASVGMVQDFSIMTSSP